MQYPNLVIIVAAVLLKSWGVHLPPDNNNACGLELRLLKYVISYLVSQLISELTIFIITLILTLIVKSHHLIHKLIPTLIKYQYY